MKYMLLIYLGENAMTELERTDCYEKSTQLARDIHSEGKYLGARPLQPVSTATSVQIRQGKRIITDGPFAETREHLGGFYLVDVANLDEALAIAAKIPAARFGTVEVRPIMEIPGLPEEETAQLAGSEK